MARLDAIDRDKRTIAAEDWKRERERYEIAEKSLTDYYERVERIVEAVLADAGYHRHHRGEWRKRRGRD
jgi:hypothetical protein